LFEFLRAESQPGVQVVAEAIGLENAIAGADWVFTGEGCVDAQTVQGKTPFGGAQLARRHNVPVIVFGGRISPDASILLQPGVNELVMITPEGTPVEKALRDGPPRSRAPPPKPADGFGFLNCENKWSYGNSNPSTKSL
jgi:glycerate kinase